MALEGQETAFGRVLQRAISDSGMSLTGIVDDLARRGQKCTQATLSYWQASRSLPRRRSSMEILPHLEQILAIDTGALAGALAIDLARDAAQASAPASAQSSASDSPNFRMSSETSPSLHIVDSELSFAKEVERVSLVEQIRVSPDRCSVEERVTCIVRAHHEGGGTFHVGLHLNRSSRFGLPNSGIADVAGAHVAEEIVNDDNTRILRLELPPDAAPGQLCLISYVNRQHCEIPFEHTTERMFPWRLERYGCDVHFEGTAPAELEWTFVDFEEAQSRTRRTISTRSLPVFNNSVQVVLENVGAGSSVIRWYD